MPKYDIEPAKRILDALRDAHGFGLTRTEICERAHVCYARGVMLITTLESRGLMKECKARRKGKKVYQITQEGLELLG